MSYRLSPEQHSSPAIDRGKTVHFTVDGKSYSGYAGDTLASALLANGVKLMGRSFKYHRPRGLFALDESEPNALFHHHGMPNTRASLIPLYDGLAVQSQNRWPSLESDIGSIAGKFSRWLPSGFYYKTFIGPQGFLSNATRWKFYEYFIRHAAGLGRAEPTEEPGFFEHMHVHPDLLVVGAGIAGITSAVAAARRGKRVLVIDMNPAPGGDALYSAPSEAESIDGHPLNEWVDALIGEFAATPGCTYLPNTTVTGVYDHSYAIATESVMDNVHPEQRDANEPVQRLWKIRATEILLATGALERPLLFANNDLPGVMLCETLRGLMVRFAVLPGRDIVIATNNDAGYRTAILAAEFGANITVIDARTEVDIDADALQRARTAGAVVRTDHTLVSAAGKKIVEGCTVRKNSDDEPDFLTADIIVSSGGFTPTIQLFAQSGGRTTFDEYWQSFLPGQASQPIICAGACGGRWGLNEAVVSAQEAVNMLYGADGLIQEIDEVAACPSFPAPAPIVPVDNWERTKQFVDLQNDVTVADIALADRENFQSVEHVKRYTTTGMATDQGKTSNILALSVLAALRGQPIGGHTTFRPPYMPLMFGAIAGPGRRDTFHITRHTPLYEEHVKLGAVFDNAGDWKRPFYYPAHPSETFNEAVQRECRIVRNDCGIFDASTLGKIDLRGSDAPWFLNMLYTNAFAKLPVGKCRYGLMLNENGTIMDDGVTSCIGENHYHMTTTSGGAAGVMSWMEQWFQTEWPTLDLRMTSTTEQWGVVVISGPRARAVLEQLCPLDGIELPFMTWHDLTIAGIPARVYRISFTGELTYEINVPANQAAALWQAFLGLENPPTPYGTETMHVLRAEKGYIVVGHDTDGTTTPADAGMAGIVSKKKDDFLGRRSLFRAAVDPEHNPDRYQLVGYLPTDTGFVPMEGAAILAENTPPKRGEVRKQVGYVTSAYMSSTMERSFGMAMVKNGSDLQGKTLYIPVRPANVGWLPFAKERVECKEIIITGTVFYDKEGARLQEPDTSAHTTNTSATDTSVPSATNTSVPPTDTSAPSP